MCDYSLESERSRPAKIGDKLVTKGFRTGTRGFVSVDDLNTAVCVLPGTELAFGREVSHLISPSSSGFRPAIKKHQNTAIFRQINKGAERIHHDALEFPDGDVVLLTQLEIGQEATVLQLPAEPRIAEEAKKQERAPIVAWHRADAGKFVPDEEMVFDKALER